jgi:ribokinase
MTAAVVVVGSINLDETVTVDRLPAEGETLLATGLQRAIGGKGANQAVAAARQAVPTAFVGAVGPDGGPLLAALEAEGIDLTPVAHLDSIGSGRALITVNTIVVAPAANGALTPDHVPARVIAAARVLLCQLEIPLETVAAALSAARAGGTTAVLNPAPARPVPPEILGLCDLLVPNEHEAAVMTGIVDPAKAAAALAAGCPDLTVIVTCGDRGSLVCSPDGTMTTIAPIPVRSVDSVAAGDAFCGVLGASLAAGLDLGAALRRATAAGAHAVTVAGALPSLPRPADIDALLAGSLGANWRLAP